MVAHLRFHGYETTVSGYVYLWCFNAICFTVACLFTVIFWFRRSLRRHYPFVLTILICACLKCFAVQLRLVVYYVYLTKNVKLDLWDPAKKCLFQLHSVLYLLTYLFQTKIYFYQLIDILLKNLRPRLHERLLATINRWKLVVLTVGFDLVTTVPLVLTSVMSTEVTASNYCRVAMFSRIKVINTTLKLAASMNILTLSISLSFACYLFKRHFSQSGRRMDQLATSVWLFSATFLDTITIAGTQYLLMMLQMQEIRKIISEGSFLFFSEEIWLTVKSLLVVIYLLTNRSFNIVAKQFFCGTSQKTRDAMTAALQRRGAAEPEDTDDELDLEF
ncbi:unnamed protein product [Soboliphyme baturini]|uniref:G_PROTEIN_RECEP_F1_2 domain-containing protein n=1 Tax=Soboliphyme baturini TaxID=241478 RepID=A0A183IY61_9BILA|nr:unnamed protein product [Soboliphyme baturini]